MSATKTADSYRPVMLSQYHGNQPCQPQVESRRCGNQIEVRWHWTDATPGTIFGRGSATGDYYAIVRRLESEGIFIADVPL